MTDGRDLTEQDIGLGHAIRIQRFVSGEEWPSELDKLPEAPQAVAREYLRGMWTRMRNPYWREKHGK